MTDAMQISANARCVVRKTGEVACLADNRLAFELVEGLANVRDVDHQARCFLVGKGGVKCLTYENPPRIATVAVTDARALAGSWLDTCVIRTNGQVGCIDSSPMYDQPATAPMRPWPLLPVTGLPRADELVLDGGLEVMACARVGHDVKCNFLQRTGGRFQFVALVNTPLVSEPAAFRGTTQLSLRHHDWPGQERWLEAIVDGKVVQLDMLTPWAPRRARILKDLSDAISIVEGCAIRRSGAIACWGRNDGGVLAQPTTLGSPNVPPTMVVGLSDVVDLGMMYTRTFALTHDHRVWEWGGEYGNANAVPHLTDRFGVIDLDPHPAVVCFRKRDKSTCEAQRFDDRELRDPGPSTSARGDTHACALRQGRAWCWNTSEPEPAAPIDGVTEVTSIASGAERVCAVHDGGRVSCWRYREGKLVRQPERILDGAVQVAMGYAPQAQLRASGGPHDVVPAGEYGCAIMRDRRVTCWGANLYGELGDGSFARSDDPIGVVLP